MYSPHPSIHRLHSIHAVIACHAVVLLLNDAQSARTSPHATRTETLAIASLERTATVAVRYETSKQLCIISWKCHVHSPKSSPKVSFLTTSHIGSGTCPYAVPGVYVRSCSFLVASRGVAGSAAVFCACYYCNFITFLVFQYHMCAR